MKSLFNHSAFAEQSSGLPPKLTPFNVLSAKLSRSALKGFLGFAVLTSILSIASDAHAYMRRGAFGPAVADVQAALGIPADGLFGCQTQRAVIDFQIRAGLAVDGIVGPETLTALFGVNVVSGSGCGSTCGSSGGLNSVPPGGTLVGTPVANNILEPGIKPPSNVLPPAVTGPYVVVVPGADGARLAAIQQVVPNSIVDGAPQGTFINAGGYPNYSSAREVAGRLRGFGFDARVDYFQRYEEADKSGGEDSHDSGSSTNYNSNSSTSNYTPYR